MEIDCVTSEIGNNFFLYNSDKRCLPKIRNRMACVIAVRVSNYFWGGEGGCKISKS